MINKSTFFKKHKATILYGVSLAVLLFVLKWLELRFLIFDHALEIYIGAIALLFTGLGIWLALKLAKPKVEMVVVEKQVYVDRTENFTPDTTQLAALEITNRELEILNLMAQGYSNQEIADTLFVSLSTIKTHNQNLFTKLAVKRRTQAVEIAKRLNLIA